MTGVVLTQAILSGLLWGAIFALIALGLTMIFGVMDIVNFAHGDFLMVAMYVAYTANAYLRMDPLLAIPLVAGLMYLLGIVVYRYIIKRVLEAPSVAQITVTFGLGIAFRALAHFVFSADYRQVQHPWVEGRVQFAGIVLGAPELVAAVGALLMTALLYWFITKTETGWALQAVAQNKQAAALMGINVDRFFGVAWGLGLGALGVAGALLANFYYIHPDVGAIFGGIAFVTVALGGFGSIQGALVAGLIIGLVESLAGVFISPQLKYAFVFSIYLLVVFIRPKGLMGTT
ncbi:MAG TPA: branched-chain amino acid ABC transporter permease [Symbiobacteriaceae bacterium]